MNHWLNRLTWLYAQLTATPRRRIALWATLAWLDVRLLQVGLTVLTLQGTMAARFGHWQFWDGWYFSHIAADGYDHRFLWFAGHWPLYPWLAHLLILAQLPEGVAMLAVSNLGSLAALCLVGWLVWQETQNEGAALLALLLLAVSPLAVFFSAMYSDGLFVALVAAGWLAARTHHWRIAGLLVGAAVITRPFGIALLVALGVEFIYQRQPWRRLAWLLIPSAVSLSLYALVLWQTYGTPLAEVQSQQLVYGHAFRWPWQTLWLAGQQLLSVSPGYPLLHMLLDVVPLLLTAVCVAVVARTWPASFTVYVSLVVGLCLISPAINVSGQYALVADGRYMYAVMPLVLIPVGCWLTRWRRWSVAAVAAASLAVQLALTIFVLHGGWLV